MASSGDNALAALGAATAIGLQGLAERRKADELDHLLQVAVAIVTADYISSLRAASHSKLDDETRGQIIMQRPQGVPLNVDGMACTFTTQLVMTDEPPLYGLQYLNGTITGPYAAIRAIAGVLNNRPQPWLAGDPKVDHHGQQATLHLRLVATSQDNPDPYIMFVAGRFS